MDLTHGCPTVEQSAPGSFWQVLEQPSPLTVLPSSQVSLPVRILSPHNGVQRLPGTRHSHPASMVLQSAEQPSPLTVLPSSQVSSADRVALPQVGGMVGQAPLTARHRPPEQQPSAQASPVQQMSPSPPHLAHNVSLPLAMQAVPAWHRSVVPPAAQQDSPVCPQEAHAPFLQASPS
jgi:hypothetical protein